MFIKYIDEEYKRPKAAEMFRRHKANVVQIKRGTKCWMVVLRYCMKVRMLVMTVKTGEGGRREMADAGWWHEDLLREAKEDADANDERRFIDNPYVAGGEKEHLDPSTGQAKQGVTRVPYEI